MGRLTTPWLPHEGRGPHAQRRRVAEPGIQFCLDIDLEPSGDQAKQWTWRADLESLAGARDPVDCGRESSELRARVAAIRAVEDFVRQRR
jgi:hypothetical protein